MPDYYIFPNIDPVALHLGFIKIHWYGLAYLAGVMLGWVWCRHLIRQKCFPFSEESLINFMPYATLGVVLGGRLGHVLFYGLDYYLSHSYEIFMLWKPGMSFHGGLIGVIAAMVMYTRAHNLNLYRFGDMIATCIPLGLFFGRIANYINGELYGRITEVPWAIIFPHAGRFPRHPSQLYEAALEGIVLFILVNCCFNLNRLRNTLPGQIAGVFLIGYAVARIIVEYFRAPEIDVGRLSAYVTFGQILTLPMLLYGFYLYLKPRAAQKD